MRVKLLNIISALNTDNKFFLFVFLNIFLFLFLPPVVLNDLLQLQLQLFPADVLQGGVEGADSARVAVALRLCQFSEEKTRVSIGLGQAGDILLSKYPESIQAGIKWKDAV